MLFWGSCFPWSSHKKKLFLFYTLHITSFRGTVGVLLPLLLPLFFFKTLLWNKCHQTSLLITAVLSSCSVIPSSFASPWTVARQAPLSMGFSRQEYWNGLPFPSPGKLPDPGIKPTSSKLASRFFTTEPPGNPHSLLNYSSSFLEPTDFPISLSHSAQAPCLLTSSPTNIIHGDFNLHVDDPANIWGSYFFNSPLLQRSCPLEAGYTLPWSYTRPCH